MKILIYEPGEVGHRPVYRRYIYEAFASTGCVVTLVTDNYTGRPLALVRLARQVDAQWIFVCTLDGMFSWLTVLGIGARVSNIKVAGIYYLFNNLYEGWKSIFWRASLQLCLIQTIFVPDLMYIENVPANLRLRIIQIPDAWDARFLKSLPREEGLKFCAIDDPDCCVFLLLGAISLRKGLDQLLLCLRRWDFEKRPHFKLLVAGKMDLDAKAWVNAYQATDPASTAHLLLIDRWLSDEEICHFYAASSYLCALYPKFFKVSISTAIRAFAVGKPVITGNHGMIGDLVVKTKSGLVCDSSITSEIAATLELAYDIREKDKHRYNAMAAAGRHVAIQSELTAFKAVLGRWIHSCRDPYHV